MRPAVKESRPNRQSAQFIKDSLKEAVKNRQSTTKIHHLAQCHNLASIHLKHEIMPLRNQSWENERMKEWKNERMREWKNERMREWKNERLGRGHWPTYTNHHLLFPKPTTMNQFKSMEWMAQMASYPTTVMIHLLMKSFNDISNHLIEPIDQSRPSSPASKCYFIPSQTQFQPNAVKSLTSARIFTLPVTLRLLWWSSLI